MSRRIVALSLQRVRRFLPRRSTALGVVAGVANAGVAAQLSPERRLQLGALELAFIAGAYPGIAIASATRRVITAELFVAGAFVGLGLAGLARQSRTAIAAGLLAHGAWDVVHHARPNWSPTPRGYPGFCFLADWLLALPLAPEIRLELVRSPLGSYWSRRPVE